MKIAALQMVSGTDLAANLDTARRLLTQAAHCGAELAVLPEYFCLMGQRDSDKLAIAEPPGQGPIQAMLRDAARDLGLWVVGGTLPMATPDPLHVANTTLVFNPEGAQVARYDKVHLFRFDNGRERYDESAVLVRGHEPVAFDLTTRTGHPLRVGLSVCYDLRFPELYRLLNADLLLVPAAFTHTTGQAHWEVLLRARAIENQAYVLASAQGGTHSNGRHTWGQSLVIDPWGLVLAQQAHGEGVVLADLDMGLLQQTRSNLPALQHRVF
jgi:deaminated glutathione amidase